MRKLFTQTTAALFGMMMLAQTASAQMVVSKVFYAGTTQKGSTKNYTAGEEYIELHNNSAKETNISGMYIGLIESEASTGAYLAKDRKNYEVKLKQLYQIPTDKDYTVKPWGTVVIAACAKDHSADAEGGADLSKADFTFGGMTGDSESAVKLDLLFSFNANTKAVNLTNGGDAGIVIVSKNNGKYLPYADETKYVFANGKDKGSQYLPFNAYYAMDAVEILKTKQTDGAWAADPERKRLSENQDKGYVPATEKMLRDGYIAYRKTALSTDGNIYLYDTNNSSVDFQISKSVALRGYDSEAVYASEITVTVPESGFLPFMPEKPFFTDGGLHLGYVSISNKVVKFNNVAGNTIVANNSPYLLIGAPGTHKVFYTDAQRLLMSAGQDAWIADGDTKYANGVLTMTTKNRYPMKFVNEKGSPRFVRDMSDGNPQTMKIDLEKEGRFYISLNYLNEEETTIPWGGIMPEEIAAGIASATAPAETGGKIYSIAGVRMDGKNLRPGLYIMGGRKVVIR